MTEVARAFRVLAAKINDRAWKAGAFIVRNVIPPMEKYAIDQ